MADLPQHLAQISIWNQLGSCDELANAFELNWRTPYILGYLILKVASLVLPLNAAAKLLIWISILMLVVAVARLFSRVGLDPWLALAAFPLAFGFAFYWGFFNFLLALPLGIFLIAELVGPAHRLNAVGLRVAGLTGLLLGIHGLLYGVAIAIGSVALIFGPERRRKRLYLALFWTVPFAATWVLASRLGYARAQSTGLWDLSWRRAMDFFGHLLSAGGDSAASVVAVLLVILLGTQLKLNRDRRFLLVGFAAMAIYFIAPHSTMGQIFLYERFSAFALLVGLVAFERREKPLLRPGLIQILVVLISLAWLVVLSARFSVYHRDAEGFDRLIDVTDAGGRVILLTIDGRSDAVSGLPFLHQSGYSTVRRGSAIAWSFSANFPSVLRYRNLQNPVPPAVSTNPRLYDWESHGLFDYVFVRSPVDVSSLIFHESGDRFDFIGREGMWWLYEDTAVTSRPQSCDWTDQAPASERDPLLGLHPAPILSD